MSSASACFTANVESYGILRLGGLAIEQGEVEQGIAYLEESLMERWRLGNGDDIARLRNGLGEIARANGEFLRIGEQPYAAILRARPNRILAVRQSNADE